MDDSAITCDEIIDAEAKSNEKETKTIPANFNKYFNYNNFSKYFSYKNYNKYFTGPFINYHCIIDSC